MTEIKMNSRVLCGKDCTTVLTAKKGDVVFARADEMGTFVRVQPYTNCLKEDTSIVRFLKDGAKNPPAERETALGDKPEWYRRPDDFFFDVPSEAIQQCPGTVLSENDDGTYRVMLDWPLIGGKSEIDIRKSDVMVEPHDWTNPGPVEHSRFRYGGYNMDHYEVGNVVIHKQKGACVIEKTVGNTGCCLQVTCNGELIWICPKDLEEKKNLYEPADVVPLPSFVFDTWP
jgi:hypothetical protein